MMHDLKTWAAILFLVLQAGCAAVDTTARGGGRDGERVLEASLAELLGADVARQFESAVASGERIRWQVYVPTGYDAARPAGLLVYISPTQSGEIPRGWKKVLDRHNVIWLGADRSGNRELVARRVLLATAAPRLAELHYAIDRERIYVSGLSGGGKTASMVATDYPQLFKGAIYNCGVEMWDVELPRYIDQIRRNRFVFVTGTLDQALEPTKRVFQAYLDAGIENSKLMVIRDMTHRNPGSYDFEEALEYLDAGARPLPRAGAGDAQANHATYPGSVLPRKIR